MSRLLVTTAMEETWGNDVPVLFLGEWCRRYNRKHTWSKMDALVADPFGVELEQKIRNATYFSDLSDQIWIELTEALNQYHQEQHSQRYWEILFGVWFRTFVKVAFNRYYTLDQALKNYEVFGTVAIKGDACPLATPDSRSFLNACSDDRWNHSIFLRILDFRGDVKLDRFFVPLEKDNGFKGEEKVKCELPVQAIGLVSKLLDVIAIRGTGSSVIRLVGKLISAIGTKLGRDTDAFIISSYLPFKEEIKLQLALGQIPQIWKRPLLENVKADPEARANLKLNSDNYKGFEKYLRWQLPETIPSCFLEGYKGLIKRTEEMPWPKKPKFIFTSNAFGTSEIFKAWTASKVEQGIPYFVGQHGNNYGTHAWYSTGRWPERTACDKFITWGWAESKKDTPAFVFTNAGIKHRQYDSSGGLLLIEYHFYQSIDHFDSHHECELYLEDQFQFVENLPEQIHQKLKVRLYAQHEKIRSSLNLQWKDRLPHIQIDPGNINIRKMIKQNRLVVHSYDSTGILETLAMNIPTMCFWRDGLNHLLPSAKPYYELLADAGILFYSPEAAAQSIALHWDDIGGWWGSEKVQDARQKFCRQYARTVAHPAQELKKILTENS
jgi:putative transferase (TIGR04331 family)